MKNKLMVWLVDENHNERLTEEIPGQTEIPAESIYEIINNASLDTNIIESLPEFKNLVVKNDRNDKWLLTGRAKFGGSLWWCLEGIRIEKDFDNPPKNLQKIFLKEHLGNRQWIPIDIIS